MNYPKPNNFSEVAVYVKAPNYISVPRYNYKICVDKKNIGGPARTAYANSFFDNTFDEEGSQRGNLSRSVLVAGGFILTIAIAYYIYKRIKK